jgi:hypothetical protein
MPQYRHHPKQEDASKNQDLFEEKADLCQASYFRVSVCEELYKYVVFQGQ